MMLTWARKCADCRFKTSLIPVNILCKVSYYHFRAIDVFDDSNIGIAFFEVLVSSKMTNIVSRFTPIIDQRPECCHVKHLQILLFPF